MVLRAAILASLIGCVLAVRVHVKRPLIDSLVVRDTEVETVTDSSESVSETDGPFQTLITEFDGSIQGILFAGATDLFQGVQQALTHVKAEVFSVKDKGINGKEILKNLNSRAEVIDKGIDREVVLLQDWAPMIFGVTAFFLILGGWLCGARPLAALRALLKERGLWKSGSENTEPLRADMFCHTTVERLSKVASETQHARLLAEREDLELDECVPPQTAQKLTCK